jgi:hypothetical protein
MEVPLPRGRDWSGLAVADIAAMGRGIEEMLDDL